MYKHIALIALLLPFSGYAITKQERRQEIIRELDKIEERCNWLKEVIKHNYWVLYISGPSFYKEADELYQRALVLEAELKTIDLELAQESSCTKN